MTDSKTLDAFRAVMTTAKSGKSLPNLSGVYMLSLPQSAIFVGAGMKLQTMFIADGFGRFLLLPDVTLHFTLCANRRAKRLQLLTVVSPILNLYPDRAEWLFTALTSGQTAEEVAVALKAFVAAELGRRGGRAGRGASKRRSPEHYKEMQLRSTEAQRAKRASET